ncbi:hypothetical protein [Aquibacillus rhizosphaerae]|uniref:DUF3221 domain-containing protein n=1 Tax=Aquibacillus rhizosphaerae TaxID=3051431 RepID=A0ABT7L472_9BACI|nr:hypothetical protein [Aquibacillus sp. LR5S19]MDL4839975.1 hypothetical protein [Aquibacillus sp. LR5S19]
MKRLILTILIVFLTSCSNTKSYDNEFVGESKDWKVNLIQNATVIYKDHPELEDQNEIEVDQTDTLTLTYKGDLSEVTNEDVAIIHSTFILGSTFPTVPHEDKIVKELNRDVSGPSAHIPKDMEYPAVYTEESTVQVTIRWLEEEQIIELTTGK